MTLITYSPRQKAILDFLKDMLAAREDREIMFARMQSKIHALTKENQELREQLDKRKPKKTK